MYNKYLKQHSQANDFTILWLYSTISDLNSLYGIITRRCLPLAAIFLLYLPCTSMYSNK